MNAAHALLDALAWARSVLLTGPVGPDGDSVGACLALQGVLRRRGVVATVAGTPSYRYDWLPGAAAMVADVAITPEWDAVVVLDGDRHRLPPPVDVAFNRARIRGIVDHHGSTKPDGYTHVWLDPNASSTCAMIFDQLDDLGVPLDAELAQQLYTGAIFDTGGFRFSNTTPATHRMAARLLETGIDHATIANRVMHERRISGLRLAGHVFEHATLHADGQLAVGRAPLALKARFDNVDGDLEGIVDGLVHILGVEVGVLLVEKEPGEIKYSLRSRGRIDVAAVAQRISPRGGGHKKAAGCSITGTLDEAEARALEQLLPLLAG